MTEASQKVIRQKVNITKEEQAYIDNVVMSVEFPWFWQDKQTAKEIPQTANKLNCHNGPYLSHSLLSRASSAEQSHVNRSADEFSWAYRVFADIFDKFCRDNQIEYSKIYRANLNLTWYNGELHTIPHKDHDFDHKNFIMYLTNCDKGHTLVWSDDFSECVYSVCEKNVAITFDSAWHAHQYPLLGQKRLVFVLTYI